ncbi:Multicopper oxidase [Musa troglodytarum]|uniref:Laccase n=1 Tax=Musa troglodytarum TaxID=320322 RepID=A0A9E7KCZ4_9LILI|nr:Multicopper oxidase [Musa troglodytarum]
MAWSTSALLFTFTIIGLVADAAIVEHTFRVGNLTLTRLCEERVVPAVNGQMPGPTIEVNEGDTLVVHAINESPTNMTIHWHGVYQKLSAWADGPNMVTQCSITPGNSYTYRFNVTGQEGTLWWHAHFSLLRVTVYGVLIIRPRGGAAALPFSPPDHEANILLGEWWNANPIDVLNEAYVKGAAPNVSDAFTINGQPGDLYNCSKKHTYKLEVVSGKTYWLRIINGAIHGQFFFKVAGHNFTVVGVDATYTKPYETDVVVIAPGQTVDALMVANAIPGSYYMAARPYISAGPEGPLVDVSTTTGIVKYASVNSSSAPVMPALPGLYDTPTAHRFYTNLTALVRPGDPTVPLAVDEQMFITIGSGIVPCSPPQFLCNKTAGSASASMNNVSYVFPTAMPLLVAHYNNVSGVYKTDFPDNPPVLFDFTNPAVNTDPALRPLWNTVQDIRLKKVKYNATVEIVLQNTAIEVPENHPMHLHSFNFFVLAQGFGNYNATAAVSNYNLVDPQVRNTIAVPAGGWAVIRFVANNPGVWFMHCHFDIHLALGLGTAIVVENGNTPDSILPPPPPDFPTC